jgi:hypothetical protein
MPRSKSMWTTFNKAYRAAYRVHRAMVTGRTIASGSPKRAVKLVERRALYSLFARFVNRVLR